MRSFNVPQVFYMRVGWGGGMGEEGSNLLTVSSPLYMHRSEKSYVRVDEEDGVPVYSSSSPWQTGSREAGLQTCIRDLEGHGQVRESELAQHTHLLNGPESHRDELWLDEGLRHVSHHHRAGRHQLIVSGFLLHSTDLKHHTAAHPIYTAPVQWNLCFMFCHA